MHGDNFGGGMVCLVGLFLVLAIATMVWHMGRSGDLLDRWARENCLRIVRRERRWLVTGPYFFRHNKGQDVYFVTVVDAHGNQRDAYVGGSVLGMLSDAVDVRWVD
jgi:hypothetical protein